MGKKRREEKKLWRGTELYEQQAQHIETKIHWVAARAGRYSEYYNGGDCMRAAHQALAMNKYLWVSHYARSFNSCMSLLRIMATMAKVAGVVGYPEQTNQTCRT